MYNFYKMTLQDSIQLFEERQKALADLIQHFTKSEYVKQIHLTDTYSIAVTLKQDGVNHNEVIRRSKELIDTAPVNDYFSLQNTVITIWIEHLNIFGED